MKNESDRGVDTTRVGKAVISVLNSAVNIVVLITIMLLLAFASYALWDSRQVYDAADAANYEVYKPLGTQEDGGPSFAELLQINPDVFGWLSVYGTHIDYPLVQGEDNWKYVNTSALGTYAVSGALFLDSGNARDFTDFNSIIYGHHMEREAMFGEIGNFADREYFEERRYGNLYFEGTDHGIEFFAFVHADAYDFSVYAPGVEGEKEQQEYLGNLLEIATHTREVNVGEDDRIVLLSTCSAESTNGRDILIGRITQEVFADTFGNDEDSTRTGAGADRLGFLANLPWWFWVLLVVLAAIVLALVLKKRKKNRLEKP